MKKVCTIYQNIYLRFSKNSLIFISENAELPRLKFELLLKKWFILDGKKYIAQGSRTDKAISLTLFLYLKHFCLYKYKKVKF